MQKLLTLTLTLFLFLNLSVFCQSNERIANEGIRKSDNVPIIAGHRGGFDTILPENSKALFDFTFAKSCSKPIAIEFDIRESATGSLYVMHDSTVDRTTNGNGEIRFLSDTYIETLFLKDRNGILTSEKIPLFADLLQHFQDKNIILMLDVKGSIWQTVINLVKQMDMESKCIALTFNQHNTEFVIKNTDKMMVSTLVGNNKDWISLQKLNLPEDRLIAYVSVETSGVLINEMHSDKVTIMTDMSETSTNNSNYFSQDYYKGLLINMHLGIIISDFPLYVNKLFCKEL
jgi:glycerophosphoryl diester phosphodiesterase